MIDNENSEQMKGQIGPHTNMRRLQLVIGFGLIGIKMKGLPIAILALPSSPSCTNIVSAIAQPRGRTNLKKNGTPLLIGKGEAVREHQRRIQSRKNDHEKDLQLTGKVIRRHLARLDRERKIDTNGFESGILRPHRSLLAWMRTKIKSNFMLTHVIRRNTLNFCRGGHVDNSTHKSPRAFLSFSNLSKKTKLYVSCLVIVMIWITTGTLFYSRFYDWPLSQSFFYAVDAGMSIGFCTGKLYVKYHSCKCFLILIFNDKCPF